MRILPKKNQDDILRKSILVISGGLLIITCIWIFGPIFSYKESIESPGRILIVDRYGKVMTDKSRMHGYGLPFNIPDNKNPTEIPFIQALLTIEDRRYFSHFGIDVVAKGRALRDNILYQKITSGGSSLTEQWIKNTYFPTHSRGILQKIREALLALYFSCTTDKNTLLESYLSTVYLGHHIYGIQAASETYFGKKSVEELTEEEITILLTLIHNPSRELSSSGFQEYFQNVKKRLGYTFSATIKNLPERESRDNFPFISQKIESFCDKEQTGESDPEELRFFLQGNCKTGEFVSTVDADLSLFSRNILGHTLDSLAQKHVSNGAIFALQPNTHDVLIYEGSRDFYAKNIDGQVDIITSPRQPGSSMKPFLYLLALKTGFNPDDLVLDIKREYPSFKAGTSYTSENYTLKEYGLVRFKKALGNSLNNASVRIAQELGLDTVYDFYREYGFHLDFPALHYGYSLVLGNPSITLRDLVMSYTRLIPISKNGEIDAEKFLLADILKNPDNRDISFGVHSILNTSIPQSVKTGTSSDFRDNTVLSYSPDLVMGIWVGNNDNTPMIQVTGITGAGYIWHSVIEEATRLGYIQDREVPVPDTLTQIPYCLDSNCFRREMIYNKKGENYSSRILEKRYDHRDLPETLEKSEIDRLEQLGYHIQ